MGIFVSGVMLEMVLQEILAAFCYSYESYISLFFLEEIYNYLRCSYQFGKSLLISWCQTAKYKKTTCGKKNQNRERLKL